MWRRFFPVFYMFTLLICYFCFHICQSSIVCSLFLHRSIISTGTYEENEKMRAVLKATGFDEYFFKGKDQNGCESEKQANRIQERVNPNSQNGEGELTYSVYYSAPSVISEVFFPYKNVKP